MAAIICSVIVSRCDLWSWHTDQAVEWIGEVMPDSSICCLLLMQKIIHA